MNDGSSTCCDSCRIASMLVGEKTTVSRELEQELSSLPPLHFSSAVIHTPRRSPRACVFRSHGVLLASPCCALTSVPVRAPREVRVSEVAESSARLHWERPEPPSPYFYDLTVTSAHDQSLVLKQNLTATDRVVGGLRAGQTYHVTVVCYLRAQVRAVYRGSFSTSEYTACLRKVGPDSYVECRQDLEGTVLFIIIIIFNPHPRTWLLIIEREEGREREGEQHGCERETQLNAQPGHVPRPGIEPTTFRFTSRCSNQQSHLARAREDSSPSPSLGHRLYK